MADNSSTGLALYTSKIPDIHERRSQSRSKLLCSVRGKRYILRVKAELMWSGAIINSSYAEVDIAKEGLLENLAVRRRDKTLRFSKSSLPFTAAALLYQ